MSDNKAPERVYILSEFDPGWSDTKTAGAIEYIRADFMSEAIAAARAEEREKHKAIIAALFEDVNESVYLCDEGEMEYRHTLMDIRDKIKALAAG